jgi:endonuclease YncB( thermonuclease family)
MTKKRLFKYIGLGITCLILFPFAPLIMGSFLIFKIVKLNIPKKNKLIAAGLTAILALVFTGKIVSALPQSPSPTPVPTAAPLDIKISPSPDSNITFAKVTHVVDGDTFTIENGQVVRMIGMDTPETVSPSKPVQCYGREASQKTKELLEGKEVKLEKDVSETDKYNRLLRYVYVDDIFVNEYLVKEGYAKSSSYPPDVRYQDKFKESEKIAREENKGLWNISACPVITPTINPITTTKLSTPKPIQTTIQTSDIVSSGSYTCDCKKTCPNMSCSEAQYQLKSCGCSARDNDGDGMACDSQCQ